jgi:hypothetical protein
MPTPQHVRIQISVFVAAAALVAAIALAYCRDGRLSA